MYFRPTKSIEFDQVNLLSTQPSVVNSRDEIHFPTNRIIVAPMSAIQNKTFNKACIMSGVSLPVHRFCSIEEQHALIFDAVETKKLVNSQSHVWISVGLQDYKERIQPIYSFLKDNEVGVLFDVANGFSEPVSEVIKTYKAKYELPNLMTGNVHTKEGYEFLDNLDSKFIRVGIGNGVACGTSTQTGVARGQISCINDIYNNAAYGSHLISDGGIKVPGDVAKAFAAGADYIMLGGLLAKAKESESQVTGKFYGGASVLAKTMNGSNNKKYIEGKVLDVEHSTVSLQDIINDISDGVRSAVSYCGYADLLHFIGKGVFELK